MAKVTTKVAEQKSAYLRDTTSWEKGRDSLLLVDLNGYNILARQ
jgi:hypothetical protein